MTLHEWIQRTVQLQDFDLAAVLTDQLHGGDTEKQLAAAFAQHDFDASFHRPQIILSLEIWSRENLIAFQQWLSHRCCRIQSYHVVVIGQPGINAWWQRYSDIMQLRSFVLHETLDLPFGNTAMHSNWPRMPRDHWLRERWYRDIIAPPDLDRDLRWHCLYMPGGSSRSVESGFYKEYLACIMLDLPSTLVDLRFALSPADVLANWTDAQSGWVDLQGVDRIREIRQRQGDAHGDPVVYDSELYPKTLPLYQHTFATVARESVMTQPWSCIGEKTLRPFMLGQFVIPTTVDAVTRLEDLGFWFDRDWFDFGYEKIRDPLERTQYLVRSLQHLVHRDLAECAQHLRDHRSRYQANCDLAHELTRLYAE